MSFVQINWKPGSRQLRSFGLVVLVGFSLLGTVRLLWPGPGHPGHIGASALVCFGIAAVAGGLGLTGAKAALPFYWAWMGMACVLGAIMSRVLLGLFFYALLTPLGLVMRLTGRDRLQLHRRNMDSYWHDVPAVPDVSRYERQF